jgi:hypothetical protein
VYQEHSGQRHDQEGLQQALAEKMEVIKICQNRAVQQW